MTTKVKICGLKTEAALEAALDGGADYVGLVFFPPSPRNRAGGGEGARRRRRVAGPDRGPSGRCRRRPDRHRGHGGRGPDILQLHGEETPRPRGRYPPPLGTCRHEGDQGRDRGRCAPRARLPRQPSTYPVRRPAPRGQHAAGGHGAPFDWRTLLTGVKDQVPFMLSGGLNADNVAEAIRATGGPHRRRLLRGRGARAKRTRTSSSRFLQRGKGRITSIPAMAGAFTK